MRLEGIPAKAIGENFKLLSRVENMGDNSYEALAIRIEEEEGVVALSWPDIHIHSGTVSRSLRFWQNHDLLTLATKLGEHAVSREEPSPHVQRLGSSGCAVPAFGV